VKPRVVVFALLTAVLLSGCAAAAAVEPPRGLTISLRYSRFVPSAVEVSAGVPVTITLRNDDPIAHEWIVGHPEIHAAHRLGTEPTHEGRPTEVSVPPFGSRTTTVTFAPGTYTFICHLPGHESYGMTGRLIARAR